MWSDLLHSLVRVEVRDSSVHLCCRREAVARSGETQDDTIARLRMAVPIGDSVYLEDSAVRLVSARRPVFRGGRKWKESPPGVKEAVDDYLNRPVLVALLRKAHQQLGSPSAAAMLSEGQAITAPLTQRKRRL